MLKPCRSSDILKRLMETADERFGEKTIADKVGITAGYLSTLFSQKLSCGFVDYLNMIRIEHACNYLTQNYFKTYEIAYKVGFNDEKYFSKVFRKLQGQSPSEYRKRSECTISEIYAGIRYIGNRTG